MTDQKDERSTFRSPLAGRYASLEMLSLFSERKKIETWRKLWISLAEAEGELGLDITPDQIQELKGALEPIDFDKADALEKETRHDVMAHVKAFAAGCPTAGGVIHLGATSCFVTDNTDLIVMRDACLLIRKRLVNLIDVLARFATQYKGAPTLAYTHFQPAQLTTIGKRASLWLQDLVMDLEDLEYFMDNLALRGVKGTTGTQASFLKLFDGDHQKVDSLEEKVIRSMGFTRAYPVTGQTYPRKVDAKLMGVMAGIATSASKFAADVRLLAHEEELEEPFLKSQIGSSAMAYKRNPMRCERISSLTRFILSLVSNPFHVAANQWLERTLDDSAGRRIVIPETFLATEAVLNLYYSVAKGLVVNPGVVKYNMREEISFMATENILMDAVSAGGDRQELHEKIRCHAMEAKENIKKTGCPNDLLERLRSDEAFSGVMKDMDRLLEPKRFIGRSAVQVEIFMQAIVMPLLEKHNDLLEEMKDEVKV